VLLVKIIVNEIKLIQSLAQVGKTLQKNNVCNIFFVHGTFVGNDPFGMSWVLDDIWVPSWVTENLRNLKKNFTDTSLSNLSNFTEGYKDVFSAGINSALQNNKQIACMNFQWDSQNNHIGRLKAATGLVAQMARVISASEDSKILLIGHSHAGQVFALITLFLEQGERANNLIDCLGEIISQQELDSFHTNLKKIENAHLDIVTLGTPVRYPWGVYKKYRLLNIVNHRSDVYLNGLLFTRDGDYVQHWGIEGTDTIPVDDNYPDLFEKLDKNLDKGLLDAESLHKIRSVHKRRTHVDSKGNEVGINLFVDYQDQGPRVILLKFPPWLIGKPNCIETVFGHGFYTLEKNMLPNIKIIIKNLYNE